MLAELANEQTHTVSEWIEWRGGVCPVDGKTLVQVQMRFEREPEEGELPRLARAWPWEHDATDPMMDIVAYRVTRA